MSVHYRFKSALEYDTITFDGLHISVRDLKNSIIQQKRIGKSTDFDLRITNAQTNEVYEDENALISKNTSLLIARIPVIAPKQKQWEGYGGNDTPPAKQDEGGAIGKTMDLANLDAPEDDKIRAMMSQSTQDYDPSNYVKIRGANQVGPVPQNYRCFKCHQTGHWIKDCALGQGVEPVEIKKSTGIPQSFMVPVEGPQVPGAMMMANGQYAVPALDLQAYNQKSSGPPPVQEAKPEIPDDLVCSICSDLLTDAVMIPCCGNSFCDECVRSVLLESEDHECPDCHEKDISPATLIPNRFLRKSVANFKNTTGYQKAPSYRAKTRIPREETVKKDINSGPEIDSTDKDGLKGEPKTIISEADSTEHNKVENEALKDTEIDRPKTSDTEGPPGVSPKQSPVHKITSKITKGDRNRDRVHRSNKSPKHHRSRSPSPRKLRTRRSPPYVNRNSHDRNGTPLRDDTPPAHNNTYPPPPDVYSRPPGELLPPVGIMSHGVPQLQGLPPVSMPPGAFPPGQPPPFHTSGAPPNFRLPPPGSQIPPYMAPGPYQVPNRPVFDPMGGPPPGNFGPSYSGRMRDYGRRSGRDRTPPGLIDDPLAAFNRILREKDEKRARLQRMSRRTWSRSRSRTRSFSRSPPPLRRRSRSPKRRRSRSRSRSFSISRSRSRSYSPSPRGSPLPPLRRSPPPLQARRGPPGRFRSPLRSPPLRRRIDRSDFDRDYERGGFRDKPRIRRSNSRDRFYTDRDRDYDRGPIRGSRGLPPPSAAPPPQQWVGQRDVYYPEQSAPGFQNRFPQQIHHIQPERSYELIAPPGVEQPPIPGLECELPPLNEFEKQQKKASPRKEKHSPREHKDRNRVSPREHERDRDRRDRDRRKDDKRSRSRSKTPEKWRNPSPKSSGTPEKPRKRRVSTDSKDDKRRERDRHRDHSEDDKKKSKDKKKHKDKKDDKKKKKDKRDKHKSKDRKDKKEEFKQVVPKPVASSTEETDEARKKVEEKRKQKEEEEAKKVLEERKKEERRLRFIEDEKRKKEEEAKKEVAKQKLIDEARKLLENEERQKLEIKLEEKQEPKKIDLYDEVIPEHDIAKEIRSDFKSPEPPAEHQQSEDQTESTLELFDSIIQKDIEDGEVTEEPAQLPVAPKEGEEEDSGILELHSDMDIKLDESDILAPFPEKSKWEVDEDGQIQNSPGELKDLSDSKTKVSSEVLKRAENVIFARAINSIRPIEIKKITGERAKFYADEKVIEEPKKVESVVEKPPRIPIKERLGKKIDEPDSKGVPDPRSSSPLGRRDRRIEMDKRHDRKHTRIHEITRERDRHRSRSDRSIDKNKKTKKDEKDRPDERSKEKHKRTRSRSPSEEPRKKRKEKEKEKKPKKEKSKKHDVEKKEKEERVEEKGKSAVEKRKATLDEANFEPDYDLELHEEELSEKDSKKGKEARKTEGTDGESSSSESSTSSSEDERRRKKRKSRKKKKKRDSSSSESESSSQSSESEKDRKRKKHRKSKKKKKKGKHK